MSAPTTPTPAELADDIKRHIDDIVKAMGRLACADTIRKTDLAHDAAQKSLSEAHAAIARLEAAAQAVPAEPVALDVRINDEAGRFLLSCLAPDPETGECTELRLMLGKGHSGYGLYVAETEYPEEGASLLVSVTAPAAPAGPMLTDAARYQLIRRGQHWSVVNGIGDELKGEALDAAVDAKIAARTLHGEGSGR